MKGSLKIWMVILGMVVMGTGITHMTNSYVSHQMEKMAATAKAEPTAERRLSIEAVPEAAEENLLDEPVGLSQNQADTVSGKDRDTLAAEEAAEDVFFAETYASAENRMLGGREAEQEEERDEEPEEPIQEGGPGQGGGGTAGQQEQAANQQEQEASDQIAMAMADDSDGGLVLADGESLQESSVPTLRADGKRSARESMDAPVNLQETLREYQERFPQIDQQIEQLRSSDTETNVYSVKNTAQTELKIWERELDSLYGLLCASLDEAASQELAKEQQEWTQLRDERAEEAAKRNSGGSLESVEYLASVAASNRERAYALLKQYQE